MRALIVMAACFSAGLAPAAEWSEGVGGDWTVARKAAMRDVLDKRLHLLEKAASGTSREAWEDILAEPDKYARVIDSSASGEPSFGLARARFLIQLDGSKLLRRLNGTPLCGECCRKPVVVFAPGGAEPLIAKGLARAGGTRFESAPAAWSGDSAAARGADFLLRAEWTRKDPESTTVFDAVTWAVPVGLSFRLESAFGGSVASAWDTSASRRSADRGKAEAASRDLLASRGSDLLLRALDSAWSDRCFTDQTAELHIGASGEAYPRLLDKIAALPEVTESHPRFWGPQGGVWDITFQGPFASLLKALRDLLPANFEGVDGNRIRFRFTPGLAASAPARTPPSGVELTGSEFPSIFGGLRKSYGIRPYGRLRIENTGREACGRLRLSVSIDGIRGRLFDTLLTGLAPASPRNIPVTLTFPPGSLETRQHSERVIARISLRFHEDPRKEEEFQIPVWIHPPKVFQWKDAAAISAYMDSRDSSLRLFLRKAGLTGTSESALVTAAKTYEALRLRGLSYQRDPKSRVGREGEMDEIQYPPETLQLGTGDCDDLALLYASLLMALGMETNLLVFPDHILVMVSMDVPAVRAAKLSADPAMVVVHGGRAWIAIETTLLGKAGFLEAWKAASEELNAGRNGGMVSDVVDPLAGWALYPSSEWKGRVFETACDTAELRGRLRVFERDWEEMNRRVAKGLADRAGSTPGSAERVALWGDRQSLLDTLRHASTDVKIAPNAFNNIGNLEFMEGRFEAASADYRRALRLDPKLPGVHANLALALCWGGSLDSARAHLRESAQLYGSERRFMENMGWMMDSEGRIKAAKRDSLKAEEAKKQREIEKLILQVREGFGTRAADTLRVAEEAHPVGGDWKDVLAGTEGRERMLWWY